MYVIIVAYSVDFAFNENEMFETKKTGSIRVLSC